MPRPLLEIAPLLADPFGTLKRTRAAGPIADTESGMVTVLTHERVRELLADGRLHENFPDFLRSFGIESGPFFEWMATSPLNRDGADHQRWRALMSKTFTPRSVERLRPYLRDAAHELIDGFAPRGHCEFMAEYADAYPSLGLCELIGVPQEDRERFRGWANTIGLGFSPLSVGGRIAEIDDALTHLIAYTGELVAKRRTDPRDDLVTRISQAALEDGWSDFEVQSFLAGLVFAGHETTKNQLGWMIAVLAERPDVWNAVAAGDVAVADVVEETMRYRSAVTVVGRTVAERVEVAGDTLEPGDRVVLSLWSAAHDEAVFPKPETIAPAENGATPHLSFGHGAHFCLGAALARAELQESLAALSARLECPALAEGAVWKPPVGINGPEQLPITFRARP